MRGAFGGFSMKIVTARRISQVFFLALFLWFCIVGSVGEKWSQLRGWPVTWFLQLDPLTALGTALATHTIYAGLSWALATVVLTIVFGRFFCGWLCPFGSIHQFVGFLGKRGKPRSAKAAGNRYNRFQAVKYYILLLFLAAAGGSLLWGASLQTGLLDPIPLLYRSVNLVLLPLCDAATQVLSPAQRHCEGAWLIGSIFLGAVLLNLAAPRFYCRFVCPLGALFGVLGWFSLYRVGKKRADCKECKLCEADCEGACEPAGKIRLSECVLCMNCLNGCGDDLITYHIGASASGETPTPDLARRGAVVAIASGLVLAPILRLGGDTGPNWNPGVIRPPGALPEEDFLARCIKCGQCMRSCPTNIIQPAEMEAGLEGLWTPVLNFRIGTSGCQLNCIVCSRVCPTAALRPLSLEEKLGRDRFSDWGPIRLGTAFVDRGRCLPWAMDKPCIVCQENCPVSPKAIFTREEFVTVRDGGLALKKAEAGVLEVQGPLLRPGRYATGDYFVKMAGDPQNRRVSITANSEYAVTLGGPLPFEAPRPGAGIEIQVRLQRPQVDLNRCTGCGVCEHECPVSGKRAIRVSAENESRSRKHSLLL